MPNPSSPNIQDNGTIGSLFTGYGGLDMAVNVALGGSMQVAYTSDIEPGPCAIEAFHGKAEGNPPNLGDITTLDMTQLKPVDVIVGGSPCTDVSGAGKRAGMMAETRSGLWSYQMDAVRKSRPWMVQWENVAGCLNARATSKADIPVMDERARALKAAGLCGCDDPIFDCPSGFRKPSNDSVVPTRVDDALLAWAKKHHMDVSDTICRKCGLPVFEQSQKGLLSGDKRLNGYSTEPTIRALGRVLGDLANLGYDAVWHGLTASEVGAPHRRLRIFVSAWPRTPEKQAPPRNRRLRRLFGLHPMRPVGEPWACWDKALDVWTVGTPDLFGDTQIYKNRWPKSGIMAQGCVYRIEADSKQQDKGRLLPTPTSRDYKGRNQRNTPDCLPVAVVQMPLESVCGESSELGWGLDDGVKVQWGRFAVAIHRWEQVSGRPAPCPTQVTGTLRQWVESHRSDSTLFAPCWLGRHALVGGSLHVRLDQPERDRTLSRWCMKGCQGLIDAVFWPGSAEFDEDSPIPATRLPARCVLDYWADRERFNRGRDSRFPSTAHLSPRFVEWMMGLPDGWVTAPEIWSGVPGNHRNLQLRALGNGVVPQQAAAAIDWCLRVRERLSGESMESIENSITVEGDVGVAYRHP